MFAKRILILIGALTLLLAITGFTFQSGTVSSWMQHMRKDCPLHQVFGK